ncbi:tRNAHis guanylyltransferase [Rhynchospora pubera]|uniref:tRNA(His) guanylyltransferase n=1 Tax=Rhynchospora pubera TaxID=906938 RepID=A0AAV8DE98_9POAL|nr:tRNAHis guanylyltransferase [Rhynchospora pubera]
MANSKYEYVKNFEADDRLPPSNWIVIRIDGVHFHRFSSIHEFEKPNDSAALHLMNSCASAMLKHFPDIVFAYGISDEYSFVLSEKSDFYQRRSSKNVSLFVSYFTSAYVTKWKEFFPNYDLKELPYFDGRAVCYPKVKVVRDYLAWRQVDCHINNQYNTCFWMLVKSGKTKREAQLRLKGTQTKEKNEILLQQFGINYDELPEMFKKGSCVFRNKVEEIVKRDESGNSVKRRKNIVTIDHVDIIGPKFWDEHPYILHEDRSMVNNNYGYVKKFEADDGLPPSNWIVVQIHSCDFYRFSSRHEFEKPNDSNALYLMNSCATSLLEKFPEIIFAYGVSDEYSFVLSEESKFCKRQASEIVSSFVSYFGSAYVMKWKEFLPDRDLKEVPYFKGRAVCCPKAKIVRDYLAWKQFDCHISNQYNTCFWMLVKSGKTETEAHLCLKDTQEKEKNEMLFCQFGINYNKLPEMFKKGSCVFRNKVEEIVKLDEGGISVKRCNEIVTVDHVDIIGPRFWDEHPYILHED